MRISRRARKQEKGTEGTNVETVLLLRVRSYSIQQGRPWILAQPSAQIHDPARHGTGRVCEEIGRAGHGRLFHQRQHVRHQDRPPILSVVLYREQV